MVKTKMEIEKKRFLKIYYKGFTYMCVYIGTVVAFMFSLHVENNKPIFLSLLFTVFLLILPNFLWKIFLIKYKMKGEN